MNCTRGFLAGGQLPSDDAPNAGSVLIGTFSVQVLSSPRRGKIVSTLPAHVF